ncbi:winged helix-turn-helix domain-containing protein [Lysobacter fragariae]
MQSHRLGDFEVDPAAGEVSGPAGREQLDPKVMQVLLVLAQQAGHVVTRQELLEKVWPGVVVGDDVVSRCIYQLRRHLRQAGGDERHAAMVETLPKRGYRLNCGQVTAPSPDAVREVTHVDPVDAPVRDAAPEAIHPRTRGYWLLTAGVAVVLAAIVAGAAFLRRDGDAWQDPLANARFTRVTDSEGVVPGVAMSRDGSLIAYLARLDGRVDAWISQAGTGRFRNLTQGRVPEIDNPARTLGFTPDASQVTTWTRILDPNGKELIHTWVVDAAGGQPHPYVVENASEVAWSPDGKRLVYHPAAPGDPLFVAGIDGTAQRQIHVASYGVHCHFPIWSPDGRSIYFVQGHPPDKMDLWRIAVDGGKPERITFHDSRVSYPVFLDATTLLYLATAEDGSGPWLYGLDMRSRIPHRIALGLEQYTSLAASSNGRRLVATRTTPRTSVWRIPVMERVANETDAKRIPLPASGGRMPRLGPDYLLFVSGDGSGMRRLAARDNAVTELWNGKGSRLVAGPAIDRTSQRIAFSAARDGKTRLQVMNADGSGLHTLAPDLEVEGAPVWSPNGDAILIAAEQGQDTRLFQVPLDGAPIVPITADYSRDATWSPDGRFLVYNGAEIGPQFPVRAMSADGRPRSLPDVVLPRGARRLVFLSGSNGLVVLKGDARNRNFWLVDLDTGKERQLTDFDSGFPIDNFDVSADGREIVFDQLREESDVVQIDLARR